MARYRPIFIEIWEDEDEFLKYNDAEKTLFFYLITNKDCTESGIYKVSPRTISFILSWKEEKFSKTINKLRPNVYYDNDKKYVFVKNFYRYNGAKKGRPDLIEKSIIKDMEIYHTSLWDCFIKTYPKFKQTLSKVLEKIDKTYLEYEYDYEHDNDNKIKEEKKQRKHSFEKSPFYDYEKFKLQFNGWAEDKIKRYYESAKDYSLANGGRYLDWIAAVRNWERKEFKKDKKEFGIV